MYLNYYILQDTTDPTSFVYDTIKQRLNHPSARVKTIQRKTVVPLSWDTMMAASQSASSLMVSLTQEASLPSIGNGGFMDLQLQPNGGYLPHNMDVSEFSLEGKPYIFLHQDSPKCLIKVDNSFFLFVFNRSVA